MGLFDAIREGAADVLGFAEPLAEREYAMEALKEAAGDARMLARTVEDLNWDKLAGTPEAHFNPNAASRKSQVKRAYNFYFNDPIVKRSVDLQAFYTFGKGIPMPAYRRESDDATDEEARAQAAIDNFWGDPFNKATFTDAEAQYAKAKELKLQGNIFFLCFPDKDAPPTKGAKAAMQLTDLPDTEIVEIINHPRNKKVPVFYKREFRPKTYDFESGSWKAPTNPVVRYYRDWRWRDPIEHEGETFGPPPEKIGQGFIYHLTGDKTSDMKFGVTGLNTYLKWAAGLNEYMTSRMSTVMALAQIAMQAKTKGGPKNVSQVASALSDISRLAGNVEGSANLQRVPLEQGKTKAAITNPGTELQPAVSDTNAGGAATDLETMKSQVAAGSGVPVHHLGGTGSANLTSTTSMDAPLQRMVEADQSLWESFVRNVTGWMLSELGFAADRVEVSMPPILNRDFTAVAQGLAGVIQTVDPGVSSRELVRWYVGEVLDAMGKSNTQELLDKFFPADWVSPAERQARLQLAFAAAQNPAGGQVGPGGAPAGNEGEVAAAQEQLEQARPDGKPPYTRVAPQDARGGPEGQGAEQRDRAANRRERSLEALVEGAEDVDAADVPPELVAVIEEVFREAEDGEVVGAGA